ncbi:cytochrome c oxidase subunit II [Thermus thermamylovorans]|uniref:Cytochrome c oxidase subunit 2 n=1 Tax=Thermus thermamylovorans TaxID=2509362 RepID=A0A4Q9B3J0_9DEIN|nr:cytochrome c oxidase subunit II [Thermus thermamylovorans]TBH20470.1 cytochrome c oxidase subunit II [Thermus thermamylovorans]
MRRILAALVPLGFVLAQEAHRVAITHPFSATNRETNFLLLWVLFFSILVFGVVAGALAYVTWKFRAKPGQTGEPPQIHGNDRLEVVWTVIPLVIVFILFGLTARSLILVNQPIPGAMKVEVVGYQFWWDFHYPALGLRNSNELILPVGVPVTLEITSKDVIHSFWVPGLTGKRDAIPGQKTLLHFKPEQVGHYYGFCAELCGASHARMLFRVLVVPEEEFQRFVAEARDYTPPVADARGQEVFGQFCAACHGIQGQMPPAVIGPDLGFMGNRLTLGAAIAENTPENMKAWIRDPASFKPGVQMPGFPQLSDEDLEALVRYLDGLRLEGFDFSTLPRF